MLLGCCHYEEEESSSSVPSESSSNSVVTPSTGVTCGACVSNVTPLRFRMDIGYTGSTGACCGAYIIGSYVCHLKTALTDGCIWLSDEQPRRVNGSLCQTPFIVNAYYKGLALIHINNSSHTYQVEAALHYQHTTGSILLWYHNNVPRISTPAPARVDCLSPIVLVPKFSPHHWEIASGGSPPCSSESIPSTMTLTAV